MIDSFSAYLRKKTIPGAWTIKPKFTKSYPRIIVIPAYAEFNSLPDTLESLQHQSPNLLKNTAVIVIVNNGESADETVQKNNESTLIYLRNSRFSFDLGVVDAFSPGLAFPDKIAGVGVARKIGLDLALSYSEPDTLLLSTDADCTFEKNYLQHIWDDRRENKWQAAVVGFFHRRSSEQMMDEAITHYENFLVKTADKMKNAGSIYGYPAVGSTMVTTAAAYVSVGGMPRKKATEDFYFLQELAKFCDVRWIREVLIHPSARPENRVYLGTGFRMVQARSGVDMSLLHYSDNAFKILKEWLSLGQSAKDRMLDSVLSESELIHLHLSSLLKKEKIESVWNSLQRSSPTDVHFTMQFNRWFDGLKTIRLLKYFSELKKENSA
ncbi:MAG: hypothetical protein HQ510_08175 [Candidatus Marinimicrobia bacterium]|nr:hypothetical protein [Candidatus Neomarinimicrobiota bacterium]